MVGIAIHGAVTLPSVNCVINIMLLCEGHVVGQLEFTVVPSNVTVENGETVILPCIATGAVLISYVWHDINGNISNQLAISGNSSQRMHLNDGNLTFTEVSTDDEGVYVCKAYDISNPQNNISSDPVYLTGMSL